MMQNPTLAFIAAVRRRLWLEDALQRLLYALGAVSGAMLVLAAVNAWWLPLPSPVLPIAMVLAAASVLLPLAWSPPSLEDGAARADSIFHGRSLMATALEVHRAVAPDRSPAARAVLKKAADCAVAWRPKITRVWRAPAAGGFVIAAIPAFVALLLLESTRSVHDIAGNDAAISFLKTGELTRAAGSYRDADDPPGRRVDNAPVKARPAGDAASPVEPAGAAGSFRGTDKAPDGDTPAQARTEGDAATPGEFARAARPDSRADDTPGEGADNASAGTRPAGDAATAGELASVAGNAPREPAVNSTSPSVKEVLFSERADTTFERRGQAIATSGDTILPYAVTEPVAAQEPVRAAAAPPDGHGWSTLTPAEVAYARRYLAAANNDNRN